MSLENERYRGDLARQIIESPLWNEAWETYEKTVIAKWRNEPSLSTEGREALWLSLRVAEKARRHIESIFQTGKMASEQLENMNG
jgi:hypothetical protein